MNPFPLELIEVLDLGRQVRGFFHEHPEPLVLRIGIEILEPQAGGYLGDDIEIGFAFAQGLDGPIDKGQIRPRRPGPGEVTAFGRAGHRQHQVGVPRLGRHKQFVDGQELQFL